MTGCCVRYSLPTTHLPSLLRQALHAIDIHVTERIDQRRLLPKAP
jgi:hypothetical protein